jgi:hypothetical protein
VAAAAEELAGAPPMPAPTDRGRGARSARIALAVFLAAVVAALPVILVSLGEYHWFLRDDWMFLERADHRGLAALLEPHNAHFSAVPRVAFLVLWRLFGVTTYAPYQAVVIVYHLAVVVLLRVIMRRAGVGPWLATAAAGSLLLFGPGATDILWATQIGITGAIALGLGAVVVADRDGPLGWRDAGASGLALLSLMSSASAIPLVLALGGITLLRRGWKVAASLTAPLTAVYVAWVIVEDPQTATGLGSPTVRQVADWVWSAVVGTFDALGHWRFVSLLLAAVLVGGLGLAWAPWAGEERRVRERLALPPALVTPVALLAASVAFSLITVWGRWYAGTEEARTGRYLYLLVALTLPALAVAAQALASRRRALVLPLGALFLVAVPHNASVFEPDVFGERYMVERARIVTTAVRMPFADDVPRDVRPEPDPFDGDLTIGFLLDAAEAGRLDPSTSPITDRVENEFRIRLGLAQRQERIDPSGCELRSEPLDLTPEVGERIGIGSPVNIRTLDEQGRVSSPPVQRHPIGGSALAAELPDLHLRIGPAAGSNGFAVCALDASG